MSVNIFYLRLRIFLLTLLWMFSLILTMSFFGCPWSYFLEYLGLFIGYAALLAVGISGLLFVFFLRNRNIVKNYMIGSGQVVPKTRWGRFNAKMNSYSFEGRGLYSFWGMFVGFLFLFFNYSISGFHGYGFILDLNHWFSWYGVSYNPALPSSFTKNDIMIYFFQASIAAGVLSTIIKYFISPYTRSLGMKISGYNKS